MKKKKIKKLREQYELGYFKNRVRKLVESDSGVGFYEIYDYYYVTEVLSDGRIVADFFSISDNRNVFKSNFIFDDASLFKEEISREEYMGEMNVLKASFFNFHSGKWHHYKSKPTNNNTMPPPLDCQHDYRYSDNNSSNNGVRHCIKCGKLHLMGEPIYSEPNIIKSRFFNFHIGKWIFL